MPCDGDNGKKNTSTTGIGHLALYECAIRNIRLEHNITAKKCGGCSLPPPAPAPACLSYCLDLKDAYIFKTVLFK